MVLVLFAWIAKCQYILNVTELSEEEIFHYRATSATWDGRSPSRMGDVNNDGVHDFAIARARGNDRGVLIIFGGAGLSSLGSSTSYEEVSVGQGLKIRRATPDNGDWFGSNVDFGDVNGDQISDILISSFFASPLGIERAGQVYVIFGGSHLTDLGVLEVETMSPEQGVEINGTRYIESLHHVSGGGDFNNDGFDDLLIGSSYGVDNNIGGGNGGIGRAYLLFGGPNFLANQSSVNLTTEFVVGTNIGLHFDGSNNGEIVRHVQFLGDVNGDGIDDISISCPITRDNAGTVYIIFGNSNPVSRNSLSNLRDFSNWDEGVVLDGIIDVNYRLGNVFVSGGDFNGDGINDIALGQEASGITGIGVSLAYVVFGGPYLNALGSLSMDELEVGIGLTLNTSVVLGGSTNISSGGYTAVQFVSDVTGDGMDDLLIGCRLETIDGVLDTGRAYLVYGGSDVDKQKYVPLNDLPRDWGIIIEGNRDSNSQFGIIVGSAGDINNDGLNDFRIHQGLPQGVTNTYIIYGRIVTASPTSSPVTCGQGYYRDEQMVCR
eukprot:jgi/Bigna1/142254/aug1.68_g16962